MFKVWFFAVLFCLLPLTAFAERGELIKKFNLNVSETWREGKYDLYVPLHTWHNRLAYDREHIDKYNEDPWGAGLGLSRFDDDGDWHALYAMGFNDSNGYVETMFGYAFLKNKSFGGHDGLRVGAGFTLGFTQRHEYLYIPVPLPLPMAGIGYKRFDLQAAYVPGLKNFGNVMFIWSKFRLN